MIFFIQYNLQKNSVIYRSSSQFDLVIIYGRETSTNPHSLFLSLFFCPRMFLYFEIWKSCRYKHWHMHSMCVTDFCCLSRNIFQSACAFFRHILYIHEMRSNGTIIQCYVYYMLMTDKILSYFSRAFLANFKFYKIFRVVMI